MVPEGWVYTLLGQIAEFKNGLNFTKSSAGESIKIVGVADFKHLGQLRSTDRLITINVVGNVKDDELLRDGDLLFVRSNGNKDLIGRCLFFPHVKEKLSFSGFTIRGRVKKDKALPEYVASVAQSPLMKQQISRVGGGTNISNLSQQILNDIVLPLPPLPEQKRIAQILSTWAKAIATTEKLLTNSQQQKKALMQKLLTGRRRLKDENNVEFGGKWNRIVFSDLVNLGRTKFDPKTSNDIRECIELEHISQKTACLLGSTTTKEAVSAKTVFATQSILFGKLRPYLRKYWLADREGVCSTEIWVLNANPKISIPEYVFQLVQMDFFIEAANKSSGTHMPRADWNIVKDIVVHTPHLEEQRKIAAVLSIADQKIKALQENLNYLQHEKTFLMQRLLTGRCRVNVQRTNAA